MKLLYYSLLLLKKIRTKIHNLLERKVQSNSEITLENLNILLWKELVSSIAHNDKQFFISTNVTNNNSPMLLSQTRAILILCNNFNNSESKFKSKYLIKKLSNYLIDISEKDNLYKFNQASWDLQDEGTASVWATLALLKSYETIGDEKYLDTASLTMTAMIKKLYSKETSLIHTVGDDFWCTDTASIFAYTCSIILKHKYSDTIKDAMIDSIQLCTEKIYEDGHYPYNELRQGLYLLLYHPIVILTLELCQRSKYMDADTHEKINSTNKKARKFLLKFVDENGRVFEPEIKHFSQYIISNITTLVALKNHIDKNLEQKIVNNICSFWNNGKLYLCKSEDDFLFNSDLYSVADVLTLETLFWLDIYQNEI